MGLRVSLEGDSDEICSSTEWSLQEGVPGVGSLQKHCHCNSSGRDTLRVGGRCPEPRVDWSTAFRTEPWVCHLSSRASMSLKQGF